ncbi:MAG: ankyrin repeat domain-containing protein [Alphaproteobacteria bacterium]|nr:ankyrin repeat domain-containing protein [Alphaproteobacteria bacterium]MBU1513032.1 ankyrin repeat domain-containing protein [Alphaproteobacteria bacterium]MBU2095140.1 ankyrin repeat domain-containing protein [Alphaproteobacteria bacterium]MBU2152119.1 ankyrin repeat domain-containing protein [Alphaproteobacteria bacterium]MBU2306391.1 ankyrin repeat domain-containing protein [Alphaproteobacteria bacterium]
MTGDLLGLLVRANLVAAAAIVLILALRPAMTRRFGVRVAYALWAVAPLAALASLLPARRVIVEAGSVVSAIVERQAETPPPSMVPDVIALAAPMFDPAPWVLAAWGLGAALSLGLLAWRQHSFGRSLGALRREAGVYRAEAAGVGPAVVGALFPRIIVPSDFEARFAPEERDVVMAHEQTHFRRGDPLVNGLLALAQCLCWFNPLVHVAAFYVRLDQELACDAAVMARFPGARKRYAEAMLKTQLSPMTAPLACYWPGRSAHPMKQRIAMLKAAPPATPRRLAGLALVAVVSVGAGVAAWAAQPARLVTVAATEESGIVAQAEADRAAALADQSRAQADRDAESAEQARGLADQARGLADQAAVQADKAAVEAEAARAEADAAARAGGYLVEAVSEGDSKTIRRLIAAGADVNTYKPGDGTPLVEAARLGDLPTARLLVRGGADVNLAAPGDGNPLIVAAAHRRLEMVQFLVAAGADVNRYVKYDETPLINAARGGDLALIRFLIDRGADPNLAVPSGNRPGEMRSPLKMAANATVADYLKSRGARR